MKISGRDKLKAKLMAIPKVARAEIRKALEKSAAEIAATQQSFAPFVSGALRASIGYTFGNYRPDNANVRGVASGVVGDPDLSVTIHAGDATAWYAAFVEFGTVRTRAQPFFFPAWRLGRRRARNRISRAITKAAKQVAAGGR